MHVPNIQCIEIQYIDHLDIMIICNKSERMGRTVAEYYSRTTKARELLLNGDIDGADYKTIKSENEYKVNVLEAKLSEAEAANSKTANIEPLLRPAISN
jgi:hypothetical protein